MRFEEISIRDEFIKLDSLLKFAGFAETGGMAKDLIQMGKVSLSNFDAGKTRQSHA